MGAMKALYTASRRYDRETGASLCPRPKMALEDYKRAERWGVAPEQMGANPNPKAQARAAQNRFTRGERLFKQGRRGTVKEEDGDRFSFQVQTTEEFKRGRWPLDGCDGYHGYLIVRDGELIDGRCDCPDWGVAWHGFMLCKHMVWACRRVRAKQYELNTRVKLRMVYDWRVQGNLLDKVTENGQLRDLRLGEILERCRNQLLAQGYVKARTCIGMYPGGMHWAEEVYVQYPAN